MEEAEYRHAARPVSRERRVELNKKREEEGGKSNTAPEHARKVSGSKEMWDKAVLFAKRVRDGPSSGQCGETDRFRHNMTTPTIPFLRAVTIVIALIVKTLRVRRKGRQRKRKRKRGRGVWSGLNIPKLWTCSMHPLGNLYS